MHKIKKMKIDPVSNMSNKQRRILQEIELADPKKLFANFDNLPSVKFIKDVTKLNYDCINVPKKPRRALATELTEAALISAKEHKEASGLLTDQSDLLAPMHNNSMQCTPSSKQFSSLVQTRLPDKYSSVRVKQTKAFRINSTKYGRKSSMRQMMRVHDFDEETNGRTDAYMLPGGAKLKTDVAGEYESEKVGREGSTISRMKMISSLDLVGHKRAAGLVEEDFNSEALSKLLQDYDNGSTVFGRGMRRSKRGRRQYKKSREPNVRGSIRDRVQRRRVARKDFIVRKKGGGGGNKHKRGRKIRKNSREYWKDKIAEKENDWNDDAIRVDPEGNGGEKRPGLVEKSPDWLLDDLNRNMQNSKNLF